MIKLSIVVPCYNEELNIPLIINRFNDVIDREDIEVVLVNNGSKDNSQKIIDENLSKFSFLRTVHVPVNKGYGYGIIKGLEQCRGEYIGWTHADMQTDPKDVLRALNIIESSPEDDIYVKGDRKGRPIFDQFFTIGMSAFESLYLKESLWDINAQPNIFKNIFESWVSPPSDFSLDLYTLYQAKKREIRVVRFLVQFPERVHGESSWNSGLKAKWKFIKRTIHFSLKLKKEML